MKTMRTSDRGRGELFDDWPEQYDRWFETPIGTLVQKYEAELLLEMLDPRQNECVLDVGCGTGIFTRQILSCGARITGLDISLPMARAAVGKFSSGSFQAVVGTMLGLPFAAATFDKVYSMTALEFVDDAETAVAELNRVTRPGGIVVLTTLNSLSPWAERRKKKAKQGHPLFSHMTFRSPEEMIRLAPAPARVRTAIHFLKDDDPVRAEQTEAAGQMDDRDTGACLALCWKKP